MTRDTGILDAGSVALTHPCGLPHYSASPWPSIGSRDQTLTSEEGLRKRDDWLSSNSTAVLAYVACALIRRYECNDSMILRHIIVLTGGGVDPNEVGGDRIAVKSLESGVCITPS